MRKTKIAKKISAMQKELEAKERTICALGESLCREAMMRRVERFAISGTISSLLKKHFSKDGTLEELELALNLFSIALFKDLTDSKAKGEDIFRAKKMSERRLKNCVEASRQCMEIYRVQSENSLSPSENRCPRAYRSSSKCIMRGST